MGENIESVVECLCIGGKYLLVSDNCHTYMKGCEVLKTFKTLNMKNEHLFFK